MKETKQQRLPTYSRNTGVQVAVVFVLALLLGNVSSLVDSVLHPEIPYFDEEHLFVGGVTALMSATLGLLLNWYVRRLTKATATIERLEAILPICANCKKIRRSGADPHALESWQPIELFITEKTSTEFSHGICPECLVTLYPEQAAEVARK